MNLFYVIISFKQYICLIKKQRKVEIMKKKLLSLIIAAAMMSGMAAFAADTDEVKVDDQPLLIATNDTEAAPESLIAPQSRQVKVFVDNAEILFNDQQPVIKNDFTLVPARGVFEAMNCKVKWDGETRTVTINSQNNLTRIVLNIDDDTMYVYHFTSIMNADETKVTLDVAPQIMNDRTMIPLRAISEALDAQVDWDGDNYEVNITTKTYDAENTDLLTLALEADKTEVNAGEEVTLSANLSNLALYPNSFVQGMTFAISYDKENFDFVEAYLCDAEGNKINGDIGGDNTEYTEDSLKAAYILTSAENALTEDGVVLKAVFKAKNAAEGSFALVDRYNSKLGNDITILLSDLDDTTSNDLVQGNDLIIDTTPVVVKVTAAEGAEEATEEVVEEATEEVNE